MPVCIVLHGMLSFLVVNKAPFVVPTFYIILKSDLTTLSPNNILSKYADDINLLVPRYCDVDLLA